MNRVWSPIVWSGDSEVIGPRDDVLHELPVHLQRGDRQLPQVGEGRIPRPEVVERDPHPEIAQGAENAAGRPRVSKQRIQARAAKMIRELRSLGYRVDRVPSPSGSPA